MEEKVVTSLTSMDSGSSRIPVFLGYFLQPHIAWYPVNKAPPPAKFLHCSEEGKGLQDGEWGSFDASLSFLNMPRKHIVGSSNGLLLCCSDFLQENSHYVVCNPVTREFNVLPQPHKVYEYVSLTFICKRNDDRASLDRINYEILRVGIPNRREHYTSYELETFSSLNGEWKRSHLVSALPLSMGAPNVPGLVLGEDVICWKDRREHLVVHDRSKVKGMEENVQLLKLPKDGETIAWASLLGLCEGKIHYARSDKHHIEIWVLIMSSNESVEWVLKHKVSFREMNRSNPNARIGDRISLGRLHPCNSNLILLRSFTHYYWYDIYTGKLHEVAGKYMLCDHFLYQWPCPPNSAPEYQCLSRL